MNAHETENNEPETDSPTKDHLNDKQGREESGAIPVSKDGVGIGKSSEPNTFEPEEDPDATKIDKGSSD